MSYRKINPKFYSDEYIRRLSRPGPNAQSLFVYVLTGPQTTNIPGASMAGEAMLAEALGWSLAAFRRVFKELEVKPLAKADWEARFIWVPKAIKYNPPQSPNVVAGWGKVWPGLPECPLKEEAYQTILSFLENEMGDNGSVYAEAFIKECGKTTGEASIKTWPKPTPKTLPIQEQEQYTETKTRTKDKEKEKEGKNAAEKAPPRLSPLAILWNEVCLNLPNVKESTPGRLKKESTRFKVRPFEQWREVFERLEKSPFCKGINDRGWKADFDWIIDNDENSVKVLEGKYDDRKTVMNGKTENGFQKIIGSLKEAFPESKL